MADDYIRPIVDDDDDDAAAIAQRQEDHLAVAIPGWEAQPSSPETYLIQGSAIEHAENRRLATGEGQTFDQVAQWLGIHVYDVPVRSAVPATATIEFTLTDDLAHELPAGAFLTLRAPDDSRIGFETVETVNFLGAATTPVDVDVIATVPGLAGNDAVDDPQLEDLYNWVAVLAVTSAPANGEDGETLAEYLNRFARRQRLASTHLIRPEEFELYAVDWAHVTHGSPVGRALALDLYNPADSTWNNEGMITVAVHDNVGAALSGPEKAALKDDMEALLPAGAVVNIVDPNFTTIDVTFTAIVHDGFDQATVIDAAEAALANYLNPTMWGRWSRLGHDTRQTWVKEPVVDIGSLEAVILGVDGIRRVTAITVEGGTTDVNLTGVAPLTTPGVITGTTA